MWSLWFTVFGRDDTVRVGYDFSPFWTYRAIFLENKDYYIKECVLNVLFFIPLGVMLSLYKCLNIRYVIFIGISFSALIELLQLVFGKGFSEIDDIIHNTLGCMLGYYICKSLYSKVTNLFIYRLGSK